MKRMITLFTTCLVLAGSIFIGNDSTAGQPQGTRPEQTELEIGEPIPNVTLDSFSGGQEIETGNMEILLNNMNLNAQVDKNILHSTATGSNMVSNGAFSDARGIATVIQNSGNQVVINNALILNLLLK